MKRLLLGSIIAFISLATPATAQYVPAQSCNPYTENAYNSYSEGVNGWCIQFYTKPSGRSFIQYASASTFTSDDYLVGISKGWGESGFIGYVISASSPQGDTLFRLLLDRDGNFVEDPNDYTDALAQFMPELLAGIRLLNQYPFPARGNPFGR